MKTQFDDLLVLLEVSDDFFWMVDPSLRLLFYNSRYRELLQKQSGRMPATGDDVLSFYDVATLRARWRDSYLRALTGEAVQVEERFEDPVTGIDCTWFATLQPITGKDRTVERIACCLQKNASAVLPQSNLPEQKALTASLLNSSMDIICSIDGEGRFVQVSSACEKVWGYTAAELSSRFYMDFVYGDDRKKTEDAAVAIMSGMDMPNFENRYVHKNGELVEMEWSARWDPEQQLMYCVARDATAKRTLAEQIRLSEERFKALVQDGSDLIGILNAEGNYLYVSPTSSSILGMEPEEFVGKNAFDFIHPDDKERVISMFGLLATEKRLQIPTFRFRNKDGDWRWVETIVTNLMDHPAVGGIVANSRDVTERIEREQALRLSEDSYRTLFQSSPLPKWIYDLESFAIVDVNETAIRHYGYSRTEFLQMTIRDIHPAREIPYLLQLHEGIEQKEGVVSVGEVVHQKKDGSFIHVEVKAHRLYYQNRDCMMEVCNDVTEKQQYLKELHASEQRLKVATSIAKLGYWTLDFLTNELRWSDEVYRIWGKDPNDFKVSFDFFQSSIYEEDLPAFEKAQETALKGEQPLNFAHRIVLGDGTVKWVREKGRLITDAVGHTIGLEGTVQDITEQIRLQKLVDDAVGLARVGSWEIDLLQGKLLWTAMTHAIHETDEHVFIPTVDNGIQFYHPDYRELIHEKIALCISGGESFDLEAKIITQQGRERWVRVIGEAEQVQGKCIRVYGSFQDIHGRKVAELRLQNMADNIPGVIFQYYRGADGKDELLQLSKGSLQLWGVAADAGMADNALIWSQIKAGGDYELVEESMQRSAEKLEAWHCQFRNRLPNGKVRWLEGFGTPQRMPDGGTLWDSLIIDITELKETEALLRDANEMSRIGSWELNLIKQDNDAMYWSPMTKEILEVGESYNPSLTGGFEFYEEPYKTQIKDAVDRLLKTGASFDLELLVTTQKGNLRWIRCIGRGEFTADRCVRIFGSFQDIHIAKTTEQQLREVLGSISDAFYAVDKDWKFTYFNKEAENLLKRKEEELIGKSIWEEFPAAGGTVLEEVYKRVNKTELSENFEYLFPGDGSWYEINVYPSNGGVSAYFKNIDERKKAAADLLKAYEEKTRIVESIGDAFFTMDRNFTVSYWNKAAENLIGVKREQLIGNNLWEVFPDAVSLPSYTNYHKVLATGESITFEDNYGVWLEVNAYPSEEGLSVFFRDISLRKEADQRLLLALEEKNSILERITEAFVSLDANWCYTYMNKQAGEIFSRDPEKMIGKHIWTEFPEGLNQPFHLAYEKAMATQEYTHVEEYYAPYNLWFENHIYPSPDGLSIFFRDITLRKEADRRLREAYDEKNQIVESISDAFFTVDRDWIVTYWNKQAELFLGKRRDAIVGKKLWDEYEDAVNLAFYKQYHHAVATGETVHFEEYYPATQSWFEVSAYPSEKGLAVIFKDVTYRKRYEERLVALNSELTQKIKALEVANEELEQFAFITSHDLQEPLRMITSFLNQLERKYSNLLDEKGQQYIYFATDGAKRMKQIILELLEYSRAGKLQSTPEEVDLQLLVNDYVTLRRKVMEEKEAVLHAADLPRIKAFCTPLKQTLHCLLDNALKYSRADIAPVVRLDVQEEEMEWLFIIADNGIGIEEEYYEKIFVIFQRLHNKDAYSGTGMGLAIVKKHVESWGGRVWLKSVPGEGSIFYFTVPKK